GGRARRRDPAALGGARRRPHDARAGGARPPQLPITGSVGHGRAAGDLRPRRARREHPARGAPPGRAPAHARPGAEPRVLVTAGSGARSRRHTMCPMRRPVARGLIAIALALASAVCVPAAATAAPEGHMTWAVHVSLAPTWFDPAETPGVITPFMVLYALHDALVKPMPGNARAPSLAESWSASKDGLTYEFVLRKGVKFHNGDPVTAEDVKFSFERYHGSAAKPLKDRVREVQIVDPGRVRFQLKEAWPDFMTFYGTSATGSAWIVPKKYVEKVGEDGFKKAPIGA